MNYPTKYIKENLIELLKKKGVEDSIIERYYHLPEHVCFDTITYRLNIIVTDNEDGKPLIIEINYYSNEIISFLFEYKASSDINQIIVDLEILLNQPHIIVLDMIGKK